MKKFLLVMFALPVLLFGEEYVAAAQEATPQVTDTVVVNPSTKDSEIQKRLMNILGVTGWFTKLTINVKEGVVFLNGYVQSEDHKQWATTLARNTENVVAVVNNIDVQLPSAWAFDTINQILNKHWQDFIRSIPSILIGVIILIIAYCLARLASALTALLLRRNEGPLLLQDVIGRTIGIIIFLLGIYLIFEMADLTTAAVTIISGTGLLGIILGIAFRDITENFLASILLGIYNPFHMGDLIKIDEYTGYVQGLTLRVTILLSVEGNHIQIPNAIVYKSLIRNYTSNPNRREDFIIGIGYDASITHAQEIALKILTEHEVVLKDPEPWVLVDNLGKSTINLRIYFWLDGNQHNWLKVKSSLIRLVKRAFQLEGISIPDEAREVIFPKGIAVQMLDEQSAKKAVCKETLIKETAKEAAKEPKKTEGDKAAGVMSDAAEITEQSQPGRTLEKGKNFLGPKEDKENKDSKDKKE